MAKLKHKYPEHYLGGEQAQLMSALRFDQEDLEANRDGYMTKKQRRRLDNLQSQWMMWTVLAGGFGTIVSLSLFIIWSVGNFLPLLMVGGATIVLVVYFWSRHKQLRNDLYKGIVSYVEGDIHLDAFYRYKGNPRYSIQVENLEFKISYAFFSVLIEGAPYCIYYIAASHMILSAELLHADSE
jgi:hypothetical protein